MDLTVCREKVVENFMEAGVGESSVSIVFGPEIDWFDAVNELFFEGCFDMLVVLPLSKVFSVLLDEFTNFG